MIYEYVSATGVRHEVSASMANPPAETIRIDGELCKRVYSVASIRSKNFKPFESYSLPRNYQHAIDAGCEIGPSGRVRLNSMRDVKNLCSRATAKGEPLEWDTQMDYADADERRSCLDAANKRK